MTLARQPVPCHIDLSLHPLQVLGKAPHLKIRWRSGWTVDDAYTQAMVCDRAHDELAFFNTAECVMRMRSSPEEATGARRLKHSNKNSRPAGDSCSGSGGGPLDDAMWNSADTCSSNAPLLLSCPAVNPAA